MFFPMFILFFFSIFIGYLFSEAFLGIGSFFLTNSIFVYIFNYSVFDVEFSLFFVKYMPLIISLLGIYLFFFFLKVDFFFFFL